MRHARCRPGRRSRAVEVLRGRVHGVGIGFLVLGGPVLPAALRHRQHAQALLGEAVYQRLRVLVVGLWIGESATRQHCFGAPLSIRTGESESALWVPIAAAKPRLDSNGTSASTVHPESLWVKSELAAVMMASSVACACPWPSWGWGDANAAALKHGSGLRIGGVRERILWAAVCGMAQTTRSRFSVSVPVLSKHTVSTRPRASMVRGERTSTPRAVRRWAAAS